ncbi:Translation Initiation factor eIF-4e,Translation Initiation factor eIF- 4e-like [Cinara cedri]|uniref:Translation Initiation factor eIF-4e,Translation Initiation factor eIF- 4e-like n=1 Tax=Cinara cedri TaxID=506608 RepID=A0A5E4MWV3_9HEMI|nr:Translation Initiation factor eIF-4e,Translation Initiation factor eIF- 4e-like [Cinara cedri]
MINRLVVPLSFHWTFWYNELCVKDVDWVMNIQKLFEVTTAAEFLEAYSKMKLPSTLPQGASYYFFKKGIRPIWEEEPNKGAGAWEMIIDIRPNHDLNLVWSDLLFSVISDGLNELLMYLCGITCNVRRGFLKIAIWTVKITPKNHGYIIQIGKILQNIQKVYGIKSIKYKIHERSSYNGIN